MIVVDTSSMVVRRQYERFGTSRQEMLRKLFRSIDVDHLEILNGQDYVLDLVRFFKMRERRLRK
jgi:hypothetical protein